MLIRSMMVLITIAANCFAQVTGTLLREWVDDTHTVARLVPIGDIVLPTMVQTNYDSWSDRDRDGNSESVGILRTGSHEIGDDLNLINNPGVLSAFHTSVANMDLNNGNLTQTTTTNRWYDRESGALLRSFTFNQFYGFVFSAGTSYRVLDADGFWSFLNLQLTPHIYYTEQEADLIGVSQDAIGRIITSPITLGSSSNFIRDFTDGIDIDLGPNQVNLCYAVRSTPIPAPAAAGVMAASFVFSLRRR